MPVNLREHAKITAFDCTFLQTAPITLANVSAVLGFLVTVKARTIGRPRPPTGISRETLTMRGRSETSKNLISRKEFAFNRRFRTP